MIKKIISDKRKTKEEREKEIYFSNLQDEWLEENKKNQEEEKIRIKDELVALKKKLFHAENCLADLESRVDEFENGEYDQAERCQQRTIKSLKEKIKLLEGGE